MLVFVCFQCCGNTDSAAAPAEMAVLSIYTNLQQIVSATVTSQATHLPRCHGTKVTPSERLLSIEDSKRLFAGLDFGSSKGVTPDLHH